jgi:hypothetical protein
MALLQLDIFNIIMKKKLLFIILAAFSAGKLD